MYCKHFLFLSFVLINVNVLRSEFVTRSGWGARSPKSTPSRIPKNMPYVFIHHTHIPKACYDKKSCAASIKGIQNAHRNKGWNDIGYSFLIGQDGNVYEGRGWGVEGAHTYKYNRKGYGIAFVGDFTNRLPSKKSIEQAQNLIKQGVQKGFISKDYKLRGHRDVFSTSCPGQKFYNHIKSWPHFK